MTRVRKNREAYLDYQRQYNREHAESRKAGYKKWRAGSPDYHLWRVHGITAAQKEEMIVAQGNKCANSGCGRTEPGGHGKWHVDHDHATNEIRGVLCHGCNTSLGLLGENTERINGLLSYLGREL